MNKQHYIILACVLIAGAAIAIFMSSGESVQVEDGSYNDLFPKAATIKIHDPTELDGMSREEVFAHRIEKAKLHPSMISEDYRPRKAVYGQIIDGSPWWGTDGQFCHGPGEKSSDGVSEESRFISNPYLLLAIGEAKARKNVFPCLAVWPKPTSLEYTETKATVHYDITAYVDDLKLVKRKLPPELFLHNTNARDFGFEWIHASSVTAIAEADKSKLMTEPVKMQGFIHKGGSCGKKGGCNNGSPFEPNLYFKLLNPKASITLSLWREKPENTNKPDFKFEIILE